MTKARRNSAGPSWGSLEEASGHSAELRPSSPGVLRERYFTSVTFCTELDSVSRRKRT